MALPSRTSCPERGVTLVETLVAMLAAGILLAAVTTIGFGGLSKARDGSLTRTRDSNSVQLVAGIFVGDVRQSVAITSPICTLPGITTLVSLLASGSGTIVVYGTRPTGDGTANVDVVRGTCTFTGQNPRVTANVTSFRVGASAACDGVACDPVARPYPKQVRLTGTAAGGAPLQLSVTTRAERALGTPAPREVDVLSLGGSKPIEISGNGRLQIVGALAVASTRSDAIRLSGNNARLAAGSITLQTGGGCTGCSASNTTPFPLAYGVSPTDPFAYLPAPDETGLPIRSGSTYQGPGVYTSTLNLTGNTALAAGTYVLRRGISMSGNSTISGNGVLLYNGCGRNAPPTCTATGSVSVSGQVRLTLTAPASGRYAGLLLFQDRTNTSTVSISGGGQLVSLGGVVYAPAATSFTLGAGGGGISVAGVVGTNLNITGNGTVIVG